MTIVGIGSDLCNIERIEKSLARWGDKFLQRVAAIPQIAELNIGHFLIGEAIFTGLDASVRRMRELMDAAR